jgi:hypothetical protein
VFGINQRMPRRITSNPIVCLCTKHHESIFLFSLEPVLN